MSCSFIRCKKKPFKAIIYLITKKGLDDDDDLIVNALNDALG